MFGKKKEDTNTLQQAKSWYSDRYQFVVVQRNMLVLVTLLSLVGLGATTFTVARVTESKTFEPYVIEIEEKTGITTLVDSSSTNVFTADEAVIRYFINKYIQAREGYDVNQYRYNYSDVVRLLSSRDVYSAFRAFLAVENPRSPLNLGRQFSRKVFIKSISFLGNKKAQARILLKDVSSSGEKQIDNHAITTLDYDFLDLELRSEERYINPLGFQVLSYSIEEDVTWKNAQ